MMVCWLQNLLKLFWISIYLNYSKRYQYTNNTSWHVMIWEVWLLGLNFLIKSLYPMLNFQYMIWFGHEIYIHFHFNLSTNVLKLIFNHSSGNSHILSINLCNSEIISWRVICSNPINGSLLSKQAPCVLSAWRTIHWLTLHLPPIIFPVLFKNPWWCQVWVVDYPLVLLPDQFTSARCNIRSKYILSNFDSSKRQSSIVYHIVIYNI